MQNPTRRQFLQTGLAAAGAGFLSGARRAAGYLPDLPPGLRPPRADGVEVLHPCGRVPLSFIIDDSTCLVNMGAYGMPQFRTAWPQNPQYWKPWKDWPREIPDAFVREFGEFCAGQGVRGKYSLVPYPACVGWLDRDLPGWSRKELRDSLALVRDLIAPHWDITPEMITHTRVIDLKTGRPAEDFTPAAMEISYPPAAKSADELAAYIAYALRILKNCDLPCQGVTTPGGFGNSCKSELSQAVGQAVRDVYGAELPFYFKYIADGAESTRPRLEHVGDGNAPDAAPPGVVVNVPAGTGDWFGNWDGDQPPQGEKYLTEDGTGGRLAELIGRGEPAVLLGHWAGFYCNGSRKGFEACKKVVTTLNRQYGDRTIWMKTSELARYEAARQLTRIDPTPGRLTLAAPFACPAFTMRVAGTVSGPPRLAGEENPVPLQEVNALRDLKPGGWVKRKDDIVVCFDLPKGRTIVDL